MREEQIKGGMELEFLVLNNKHEEQNKADEAIALAKAAGLSVTDECSHCMIELNTIPGTMREVAQDAARQMRRLNEVVDEAGIKLLPIENPLRREFKAVRRTKPRYDDKEQLIGREHFKISLTTIGTHAHYDLASDDQQKIQQINFLTLLDPVGIALSASSPNETKEGTAIHNWRIFSYRYMAHKQFPFQGDIQEFSPTYASYLTKLKEEYSKFITLSKERGVDFSRHSTPYDTVWGPVRINDRLQTVEIRSMGACPDTTIPISLATLFLGGLRRVTSGEFCTQNALLSYFLNDPHPEGSFELIRALTDDAVRYGLESEVVAQYTNQMLEFCLPGVPKDEMGLAAITLQNLKEKRTMSGEIRQMKGTPSEKYKQLHNTYLSSIDALEDATQ